MASYLWSSLTNLQQIQFNPALDTLVFPQGVTWQDLTTWSATYNPDPAKPYQFSPINIGGKPATFFEYQGKRVYLVGLTDESITPSNIVFSDGSAFLFGDRLASTAGDYAAPLNIVGGSGAEYLQSGGFNDSLAGSGGNDGLFGGAGSDVLDGGDGFDTAYWGRGNSFGVYANLQSGFATQGSDVDTLINIEALRGTNRNDALIGNQLANRFKGLMGFDHIDGGAGIDVAQYGDWQVTRGIKVDLAAGTATDDGFGTRDTLANIENVAGTNFADQIRGDANANRLEGKDGNDTLDGGAGADTLVGGSGNDSYVVDHAGDVVAELAGEGTDTVQSYLSSYTLGTNVENGRIMSGGTASLTGNALNNLLYAGTGSNVISGGEGIDSVSFYYGVSGTVGVTASLLSGTATGSGTDTLSGIERLYGSRNGDKLTGNGNANYLSGDAGNDTLAGGGGKDSLSGGSGNDVFDFNALSETGLTSATWDVIADFVGGQDKIDLSTLDANTATTTNEAFSSTLVNGFTAAGQLRFDSVNHVLYGNTDADGDAEFAIQLTGVNGMTSADFIL